MKASVPAILISLVLLGCGKSSFEARALEPQAGVGLTDEFSDTEDTSLPIEDDIPDFAALPQDSQKETIVEAKPVETVIVSKKTQTKPQKNPYAHLDPGKLISRKLLNEAVAIYSNNKSKFSNKRIITIVDFSLSSSQKRFFVIDMKSGSVWRTYVAHGIGSDKNGEAHVFGNKNGSRMSSLGAFRATKEYFSLLRGHALRLEGLSGALNSNAMERGIVLHGAKYVKEKPVRQGRSWGCFAVPWAQRKIVAKTLSGGSLLYAGLGSEK